MGFENLNGTTNNYIQHRETEAIHSLAKFKVGDRVKYLGDHPALKNKELMISQIHPESIVDFYYSCTDPAKPKGFTPRIKEDDLRNV